MLHAVEKRKTTRARQYAHAEHIEEHNNYHKKKNLKAEDEITSIVIGPLEFLSPVDSLKFWLELLELNDRPDFENSEPVYLDDFKLWMGRDNIEPDGFIFYKCNKNKYIFLLEVKWNSKLEENQLENQWDKFLKDDEKPYATHVFLGKDTRDADNIQSQRSQKNPDHIIKVISWLRFRRALKEIAPEKTHHKGFARWAELANKFLEQCGIIDFSGFKGIADSYKVIFNGLPLHEKNLFWQPFRGFSSKQTSIELECNDFLFFNQGIENEWQ